MRRRRFSIRGDHAKVNTLSKSKKKKLGFSGRQRIVQRAAESRLPVSYSAALCLANLLYPRNFPRLMASGLDKKTTFSRLVEIDKPSQKAINSFYRRRYDSAQYKHHEINVNSEATHNVWLKIKKESGISINWGAMNIGFRNKNPVFFEIHLIDLKKLNSKILALPEGKKKQLAMSLFKMLEEADYSGNNTIYPHTLRRGIT